jgi:hypothetical protein
MSLDSIGMADSRAMMEYLTYAHILNGEVYQVGDFGAVALWYVTFDLE